MAVSAADQPSNDPVTLHGIMQTVIGEGLKERYEAPQKMSHELFVLLLQIKEQERRAKADSEQAAQTARRRAMRNDVGVSA